MRQALIALPLIVLAALGADACASAAAKTQDRPDLTIPPPPPHVVPITPEPVVDPVADIPAAGAPPAARPGRSVRDSAPKPPPADKTDTKPGELKPEAPIAETPLAPTPQGPAPQLRAEGPATEATVRASLDRARGLLNTVDYRRLTVQRRKAYDDAKAFAVQAEEALKSGNVVFAQGVATKAETLAKELAGR